MRILKVIHGYPMRYNAGSEVYSQTICHEYVRQGHEVQVFSRYENPFEPEFSQREEVDSKEPKIKLNLINITRSKDRYSHREVDIAFGNILDKYKPHVVHIGHLNHLSTSLVFEAKKKNVPVLFTLHDYWLICPRGQFMQFNIGELESWQDCDGQEDMKCTMKCYNRYFSGLESVDVDKNYWSSWINQRMQHVQEVMDAVDLFVAPANYLRDRFIRAAHIPNEKIRYLDYGFELSRFGSEENTLKDRPFTFGYIGRHVPAKGIHLLIEAFGKLKDEERLIIWGRTQGDVTPFLKELVLALPDERQEKIEFRQEYDNSQIQDEVFKHIDAIVVPSIWVENSPLVIHEAQAARKPVITSNAGGMGEYVHHMKNGLLFRHRDCEDLSIQMSYLSGNRKLADKLGRQGYLFSEDGQIPDVRKHVSNLIFEMIKLNPSLEN
ncbi:glycosyltransferase [bacterium]|nr:glycosyltransferase [bacterium]